VSHVRAAARRARTQYAAAGAQLDEIRAESVRGHAEAVMLTKEVAASVIEAMSPLFTESTAKALSDALQGFHTALVLPVRQATASASGACKQLQVLIDQAGEIMEDDAELVAHD
jgi:hypothetical protein